MLISHDFDALTLGRSDSLCRRVTAEDILVFAAVSGDLNPAHLDPAYAATTPFRQTIAHGLFAGAVLSALLGTRFPGPGTIYLNQSLSFRKPVYIGDELTVTATVSGRDEVKRWVTLACEGRNQRGELVFKGEAQVIPPANGGERPEPAEPVLILQDSGKVYQRH